MGKRPTSEQHKRRSAQAARDLPERKRARYRLGVLLGVLLLLAAAVWYSGSLAGLPRSWADQAFASRDFEQAWRWMALANRFSQHDPANALLAARIARAEGDAERANQELANAKKWDADPKAVRREQLLSLVAAGRLEGIEDEFMKMLGEGGPQAAELSEAYANGLAMLARFDDAREILEAWRLDFPHDARPDYRLGRIDEHLQAYDEAEASYRRSLAKDPAYLPARYSLGRVLQHQRRAEEAAEQFRMCLKGKRPEAAQVELAIALKALGETDQARSLLKQVVAAPPERLRASYLALDEQPELFKAASEYGRLEADAGNFADARHWLTVALEANPQDLMARYALAVSLRGLNQRAEAEEQFALVAKAREAMGKAGPLNARINRDPADVEARFELGKLVLEHESERSGLYWIRSVFAYQPDYVPAHELLARHYAERSRHAAGFARLAEHHRNMAAAGKEKETPR